MKILVTLICLLSAIATAVIFGQVSLSPNETYITCPMWFRVLTGILSVACAIGTIPIAIDLFKEISMRKLLCLFIVLSSAASADAAGLGLGAARVRVRAPGVQVNVGARGIARGGLFGRGLFQRREFVRERRFNRGVAIEVGHYNARSFVEVRSHAYSVYQQPIYVQPTYAQPVIVPPQPVYVQQPVYTAPTLQSQYSAPLVQYITQPIAYYAAPVIQYATSHCAPAAIAVSSYSSCGSAVRSFVRFR